MILSEALADHCRRLRKRGCSERSVEANQWDVNHYLADWLPRELETITRAECEERHTLITDKRAGADAKQGGTYAANRALRTFRAIWNSARKRHDLPTCPSIAVEYNRESRRQEPIADLREWYRKLTATAVKCIAGKKQTVPVVSRDRQTLMLTLLFLGCRSAEACSLQWQHVDFDRRTVHFPCPKGGALRAYTVPMPGILQSELESHASFQTGGSKWVFPSDGETGHVVVSRQSEYRKVSGKLVKRAYLPSAHRLRDTYITVATELGIDWAIACCLVNHKLPGVHGGYAKPRVESMRPAQDLIAQEIQRRAGITAWETVTAAELTA
jgi:integrase